MEIDLKNNAVKSSNISKDGSNNSNFETIRMEDKYIEGYRYFPPHHQIY